jgi:hypothetical protein
VLNYAITHIRDRYQQASKKSYKMQKNQDIFISHSGKDKPIVDDFIDLILVGGLSASS